MNAVVAVEPVFTGVSSTSVGQVGMTLAAIAYAPGLAAIQKLLADPALATAGRWSVVWYATDAGNQVFVVRDSATGQYAIAIRGSVTDPHSEAFWIDWFRQDLAVFRHVDWPYGGAPGAKIAHGALLGLNSLLSLKDANGVSLTAFLRNTPPTVPPTAVVGHSLGGALADVLAAYLHQEFTPGAAALNYWPVTFAGPTAGNALFAAWLDAQFAGSAGRYYNSLDVVPQAWAGLPWIAASFPGGPSLPIELRLLVDGIQEFLKVTGADYTATGTGTVLPGTLVAHDNWFAQAGAQHAGANYLNLVGAPALPG